MSKYSIAALPGDGIGPECLQAALTVLASVQSKFKIHLDVTSYEAGAEHYREYGVALPDEVLDACLKAEAVLLAAIGLPDVRKPDGTEVQPDMMMGLRRALNLYVAVRPVKLFPGVHSPLNTAQNGIDFVILRENLEGLFASFGGGSQLNNAVASDTLIITREGTERLAHFAFQLASRRNGRPVDGKRMVTCVDKANVFRSFAFFRRVFLEVAEQYDSIESSTAYVDAMSLYMVTNPGDWDVLVMENQFGDILSDLGAAIVGGLGLAPSAEIGEQHALFQPSHGSAPQLAGKNVANPLATILSAGMMLEWLGQRNSQPELEEAGRAIETAVKQVLEAGNHRTADMGGNCSTSDMALAVADRIENATD